MIEKPLDRLNYYNGQRLEASDLKLEQEYHIRTRRWLNKSLYEPGIASGLTIRAEKDAKGKNTHNVSVGPGLALDAEGREILLLEEKSIVVHGRPQKPEAGSDDKVKGLFLTIRYDEKSIQEERNGCIPQSADGKKMGNRAAWNGPALVRAEPVFNWRDALPYESSGEIVLGAVELDDHCNVSQTNTGVRRYVGAASDAKVRQYALEGERHIDKDNPGRIYFHIRGRQPKAVTLYLRAEKFSTLYYTELGQHKHTNSAAGFSITIPEHRHTIEPIRTPNPMDPQIIDVGTGPAGVHTPSYRDIRASATEVLDLGGGPPDFSFQLTPLITLAPPAYAPSPTGMRSLTNWTGMAIDFKEVPNHSHSLPSVTNPEPQNTISLSGTGNSSSAGISDVSARNDVPIKPEQALTYVDALEVWIGPDINRLVNHTNDILGQLRAAQPTETWDKLGNGGGGHVLVNKGTGAIKLDFLPNIAFTEDEYVIQLSVSNGGGRILYNLYVE